MAGKIKIGMILELEFPPDDRPEKEALSLIEAGYEVHLLCLTWGRKPLSENYKGIHVSRFKLNRKLFKKLSPTYLAFPFYKKIWKPKIEAFVKNNQINIIHVHDLPLTSISREVAQKYNCKLVCDQHEYWSRWIVNTAHYNTIPGRLIKALSNWEKYEKENLAKADLVITVSEPLRECYINDVGLDEKKIITIPNTPNRAVFKEENIKQEIVNRYKDYFVLFYAGAIDILRGIDLIINSLKQLSEYIPNIKFLIAGRVGKNSDPGLMAKEKGVEHLIEFLGWIDINELSSYMAAAEVCVFTPHPISHEIKNTIATKIYQYMAMGKPIITSQVKMMREFVEQNNLGFAVNSKSTAEFIDRVKYIFDNYTDLAKSFKQNSRKVLKTQPIFWDQTVKPLISRYNKLSE